MPSSYDDLYSFFRTTEIDTTAKVYLVDEETQELREVVAIEHDGHKNCVYLSGRKNGEQKLKTLEHYP